jgi:putative SOS response-associated peptidase YedK
LASGDFFYFAGIWRPATWGWPESYAIQTTEANDDVAPYHDRQMAVLRRDRRMDWLDLTMPEDALLQPLPTGSFKVARLRDHHVQDALAF